MARKRLSARTSPTRRANGDVRSSLVLVAGLVGVFWVTEIFDQLLLGGRLDGLGIEPRDGSGLLGILFAPFLHAGFGHLLSNTVPFLVLGGLLAMRGRTLFFKVSLAVMLVGGLAVWLLGRSGLHVGASGVIFGYLGYHLAAGWFERSVQAIVVAVLVGAFYGGLIFGVLPTGPGISWEGHLFGFVAGAISARALVPRRSVFSR